MRLKRIIAAMLLVGISSSALAALASNSQAQRDAVNARVSRVDGLLKQNQGGTGLGAATMKDWFDGVAISGVVNVDAISSNRSASDDFSYGPSRLKIFNTFIPYRAVDMFNHEGGNALRLADANVLVDAVINSWTAVHLGANYRALSHADGEEEVLEHSLIISDFGLPVVDEVYVTLMNANSPFYARIGRQYLTFGDYNIYEAVPTFTQLLSETNEVAIVIGYNDPSTFGANVYTFRGLDHSGANFRADNDRTVVEDFGATLSFGDVDILGYKVGLGYLHNMADVAYIANQSQNFFGYEGYTDRVHALSADAAFKTGPFDANVKYVTALDEFNVNDIAHEMSGTKGASPWAVSAGVGYSFNTLPWPAHFGLSYQQSGDAASVGTQGMPEHRYQADINIGVAKIVNVGFTLFNDKDYAKSEGGSGNSSFTGVLRVGMAII